MTLITDRKQTNVSRLETLSRVKWDDMSVSERAEWSGNPLTAGDSGYDAPVNLIPPVGVGVTVRDGSIIASSVGTISIGTAADFAGNAVTLSANFVSSGGTLTLKWSDGTSAGIQLSSAGVVTETLSTKSNATLVLEVGAGYYGKVMLELGRVRHEYVPYTEIIPTEATKGAYNYSDLNRVERAVKEIAEILGVVVETKTDWAIWDMPTKNEVERYLGNVRLIQSICGETTLLPDSLNKMSYDTANDIEAALMRCRTIAEATLRCGEVFCGEV